MIKLDVAKQLIRGEYKKISPTMYIKNSGVSAKMKI